MTGPVEVTRKSAEDPAGYGLFALMRHLEQNAGDRPRIGRNARLRDTLVRLGQDPFLAFPDSDLAGVDLRGRQARVRAQFLGFFGAFGALPLNWTEEVRRWFDAGDDSFVAFTDIFAARFQELFYRAWADSRAIAQFDHPTDDRFQAYLLSIVGLGTPAFRGRDDLDDTIKLRLTPLAMGRVKSPVRLKQMLSLHFGKDLRIDIEELVPTWLDFEADALSIVGKQGARLGRDVHLGSRARSVGEKIRLHVRLDTMEAYRRFLPGGPDHAHLRDITFWYLGQAFEIEVQLWLPATQVRRALLGGSTQLGWMACIAPTAPTPGEVVSTTRYILAPLRDAKDTDEHDARAARPAA